MSAFPKQEAYRQAIAIVTAGLASQSIKLNGSGAKDKDSQEYAASDLAYLQDLIAGLAKSLTLQDRNNP